MSCRLGMVSDLHADLAALAAGLEHLRRLGCDQVVCAGDVVDGDVFPDEVIARVLALTEIRVNLDPTVAALLGAAPSLPRQRWRPIRDWR